MLAHGLWTAVCHFLPHAELQAQCVCTFKCMCTPTHLKYSKALRWLGLEDMKIYLNLALSVFFIVLCTTFVFTLSKKSWCSVLTQRHS